MKTKLTLSIEKSVIEEAKEVLKAEGQSLSRHIENYLKSVITKKRGIVNTQKEEAADFVAKLSGVFKLPKGMTAEEAKWEYFKEKYHLEDKS